MNIPKIPKPFNWILLILLAVVIIAVITLYLNIGGVRTTISGLINRFEIKPSAKQQLSKPATPEDSLSAAIAKIDELKQTWEQRLLELDARENSFDAREKRVNQDLLSRQQALEAKEGELNVLKVDLEKKRKKLDADRKKLEQSGLQASKPTSDIKNLRRLAKGFEEMKTKDAAKMLSQMVDDETEEKVLSLLQLMDERTMMEILSKFPDNEKATKLELQLLGAGN